MHLQMQLQLLHGNHLLCDETFAHWLQFLVDNVYYFMSTGLNKASHTFDKESSLYSIRPLILGMP